MLPGLLRSSVAVLLIAGAASLIYFGADMASRRAQVGSASSIVQSHLDERSEADQELQRRREIRFQRIVLKDRAIRDLLAGRLTLVQAAARFRGVEQEHPATWWAQDTVAGPAEGERLCRMVIDRATGWVETNLPSQAPAVAARLETELEQQRGPDGTVLLPY